MTHLKSTRARKRFVKSVVSRSNKQKTYKIYRAVEKAIGYKHKAKSKSKRRQSKSISAFDCGKDFHSVWG